MKKEKVTGIISSIILLIMVIGAAYAYLGTFIVDLNNNIAVNINSVNPGNAVFTANVTQLNLDVYQDLGGKTFSGKISVENVSCDLKSMPAYLTLLKAYGGVSNITQLDDSIFTNVTTANEKGMYAAKDDLGTSYYYRGAVNNNWVKFGKDENQNEMYWRIIRINGDNTIRMIYSGTTDPSTDSSVINSNGVYMTGTKTQIGTEHFNSDDAKAEYVGYQYIEGEQYGYGKCDGVSCVVNGKTVYNSEVKQKIDSWYITTSLAGIDASKVADAIYCNDRSPASFQTAAWTSTGASYSYGANGRFVNVNNQAPVLSCLKIDDKFTVNTSNGNGTLSYPAGLITADEIVMAGNKNETSNNTSYIYSAQDYWTMSPRYLSNSDKTVLYDFHSTGFLNNSNSTLRLGIRPVINLSKNVTLSGNGTYNSVYTVS